MWIFLIASVLDEWLPGVGYEYFTAAVDGRRNDEKPRVGVSVLSVASARCVHQLRGWLGTGSLHVHELPSLRLGFNLLQL